ncbi:hypothetical protein QUB00_24855 [Microcoleus sp. F8_C2]
MSDFSTLIQYLMKGDRFFETATEIHIQLFGSLLRREKTIRFYVDGTPNFGHQANTIHIMKRIIDYFGYSGSVEIIYAGGNTTLEKLALLLAELNPNPKECKLVKYGNCKNITFLEHNNENLRNLEFIQHFA